MANTFVFVRVSGKTKDITIIGIFCYLSIYYMSILRSHKYRQVLALKYIYKKMENSENLNCHGNGEENRYFFTFVFNTQYKL